jgi:hypothetical protein
VALQRDGRVLEIGGNPGLQGVDLYLPAGVRRTPVPTFLTQTPTSTPTPTSTALATSTLTPSIGTTIDAAVKERFDKPLGSSAIDFKVTYRVEHAATLSVEICTDPPTKPPMAVQQSISRLSGEVTFVIPIASDAQNAVFKGVRVRVDESVVAEEGACP